MTRHLFSDVCVIGGGPAGAATAIRLIHLGHTVTLVEKSHAPPPYVAETLAPSVLPLLEVLGVREKVQDAGFLRSPGIWLRWASPDVEYRQTPGEPGFLVERDRFDSLLLHSARTVGVSVLQPARVLEVEKTAERSWTVRLSSDDGSAELRTRAIVYATGRNTSRAGGLDRHSPPLLALTGSWSGVIPAGNQILIEAGESEWYWAAPTASRQFNATVFIDPPRLRSEILTAGSLQQVYCRLLYRSRLLKSLRGSLQSVRAYDATSYSDRQLATTDTIKVGDAAFTIDPLSSQGLVVAIGSGLHAAATLHTILCRPSDTNLAIAFYTNRLQHSITLHKQSASQFYAGAAQTRPSSFWRTRVNGDFIK